MVDKQREYEENANRVVAMSQEELDQAALAGDLYAIDYKKKQELLAQAEVAADAAEKKRQAAEGDKKVDDGEYEKIEEKANNANADLEKARAAVDAYKNATENSEEAIAGFADLLGEVPFSDITDKVARLTSMMERVSSATDLTTLSFSEQMDILKDYPELIGALERGYLTAAEKMGLYRKQFNEAGNDLQNNLEALRTQAESQYQISGITGFEALFDDSAVGQSLREALANTSITSEYKDKNSFAGKLVNAIMQSQDVDETKAVEIANALASNAQSYSQNELALDVLQSKGVAGLIDSSIIDSWNNAIDPVNNLRRTLVGYNSDLEDSVVGSDDYLQALKHRNSTLTKLNQGLLDKQAAMQQDINSRLGIQLGDGSKQLSDYVEFVDGELSISATAVTELTDDEIAYIQTLMPELEEFAEQWSDITDELRENNETLAQS